MRTYRSPREVASGAAWLSLIGNLRALFTDPLSLFARCSRDASRKAEPMCDREE
jgi:hypothetical protein